MSDMYNGQPFIRTNDDNLYYDDTTLSPTTAMFPPEMIAPHMDSSHLNVPQGVPNPRQSISSSSDAQYYFSRPPSLSPSSHSMPPGSNQSPHSSASPSSNFSISAADDFLLANSFNNNDLDMFLFQNNDCPTQPGKQGHSLFLPQNRVVSGSFDMSGNQSYPANSYSDEAFDILNVSDASPANNQRRYSIISTESYPLPKMPYTSSMASVQPSILQQTGPSQWTSHNDAPATLTGLPNGWQPNVKPVQIDRNVYSTPQSGAYQFQRQDFNHVSQTRGLPPHPQSVPQTRTAAIRRPPPILKTESLSPPDVPTVGKHNKTERRYRQKVQAAQADLRDSVPALRVLYGTSNDEQKRTTDLRAADGTVDGLGEITRPNASAKTTIFLGARLYIELLQRRVTMLQRKVNELEGFRNAVAGEDDLRQWQEEFDAQERERQAKVAQAKVEEDSFDEEDEEDEDEDEPKRKRFRAAPKPRGKHGAKSKEDPNFGSGSAGGGVRIFAAFAMSFSLLPSASTLFKQSTQETGPVASGKVLSRLPLITAEHTSRLLSRGLPDSAVPHANTLVDWGWRLLVGVVLTVLLGPLIQRWTRPRKGEVPAGSVSGIAQDLLKLATCKWTKGEDESDSSWNSLAAGSLGNALDLTALARWHIILRLNRTAEDAYSIALLALLQPNIPFLRSPQALWLAARAKPESSAALAAVLALPFKEATRSLQLLPKTAAPIAAIAEQVTLVHLNDLFSRLFVRLVDVSAKPGASSVQALLGNLESGKLGKTLSAFEREIRGVIEGVPRGSAAHALGLVLIGLWGLFTGPTPSAQAALASALAAEEVKGNGSALASVSAMLELLYPGSSSPPPLDRFSLVSSLPANALAIDRLALVCIEYIRLLTSAASLNAELSRLQRLEASQRVQKTTIHLRLIITQTDFIGLADEADQKAEGEARSFENAKEKLVGVLSVVGRRATGRAVGRDDDSGIGGDLDEL